MQYPRQAARAAALTLIVIALLAGTDGGRAGGQPATALAEGGVLEQGLATWYGPGFEGRRTACGQTYWPAEYTAASNTLPCGRVVTVTNLESGASVNVTITDRGAFRYPIVVDLSVAAFGAVGPLDRGVIPVAVSSNG